MDGGRRIDGLAVEIRCPRRAFDILDNPKSPKHEAVTRAIRAILPSDSYLKYLEVKALLVNPSGIHTPAGGHISELSDPSEMDVRIWRGGRFRLFFSHLSSHKILASNLQRVLQRFHIQAFVAHEDIEPTKEWEKEIAYSLRSCHALCALLTSDFHGSHWTDQEVGVAMGRNLLVIPIRLGQDPYGFLGKYQGIQGKGIGDLEIDNAIVDTLLKNELTSKVMYRVLANGLIYSESFANSNSIVAKLETIPGPDEVVFSRMKAALKDNSQVFGTHNCGKRIDALIAIHGSQ